MSVSTTLAPDHLQAAVVGVAGTGLRKGTDFLAVDLRGADFSLENVNQENLILLQSIINLTLCRLARNREAVRKSRLRKKAYVQRLESIKLELTQLEQELQRARQQVLLNQDDVSELESGLNILRPFDKIEETRVKPNPSLQVQPIFIDPDPSERPNT